MLYEFFYVGMLVLFGIWCIFVSSIILTLDYHFWDRHTDSGLSFVWAILTVPVAPIIAFIEIIFIIRDSKSL